MRVEIIRQDDDFHRQVWHIHMQSSHSAAMHAHVHSYTKQNRASKRHKWTLVIENPPCNYNHFDNRSYTGNGLPRAEVPLPEDVKAEAIAKIIERVEWK